MCEILTYLWKFNIFIYHLAHNISLTPSPLHPHPHSHCHLLWIRTEERDTVKIQQNWVDLPVCFYCHTPADPGPESDICIFVVHTFTQFTSQSLMRSVQICYRYILNISGMHKNRGFVSVFLPIKSNKEVALVFGNRSHICWELGEDF